MYSLVKKYIEKNDKLNALLVAQNIFNKNKGDKKAFDLYFALLLEIANSNKDMASKAVNQMSNALSDYSENADLDEGEVSYIRDCESKITKIVISIQDDVEKRKKEFLKSLIVSNDEILDKIRNELKALDTLYDRNSFNECLKKIYDLDNQLDKENFVIRQKNEYEEITSNCQRIVDATLKEFDRLDNVDYNLRAVETYEKIFNFLSKPNQENYYEYAIAELFSFDPSRLTNETIVYYNHVYNYVLSKLNDEEKVLLTKAAIKAEKRG